MMEKGYFNAFFGIEAYVPVKICNYTGWTYLDDI